MSLVNNTELKLLARAKGERYYNTGEACKYGHVSKRYASNGGCVECLTGGAAVKYPQTQQAFTLSLLIPHDATPDHRLRLELYLVKCADGFLKHSKLDGLRVKVIDQNLEECHARGLNWADRPYK